MPKRNNIVYTESIGKKGEYKIFSVKTKELLGTIKGNNIKMYWEAFDTDNKFLMSGSRKKECMDCFREMDTKRLMAKGGGIGFEKLSKQVAKEYEGDKVAPKYQHEYGKTYSKAEAKEVGDKVAGKVYWQQQGRKMEDGGNMDNLDARISKAIYKAYGNIDDALEFKQYNTGNGISPYRLVFLAVIKGFITPEEINKDLLNSAYETSSETEDDDEIGSSDTNNYVWSMLRDAGFDMEVENGRYFRVGNKMENGGNTDKMDEYIRKKREDQEKEEEGKYFAPFRAFVYSGSDQFADFKTDDFHKAVKWAKETLEQQKVYRKSSENLWAIVDEFTPIEKRNNVIYAYSEVARFGEEDMKDMKFKNGGSMSGSSNGFYIILADGSKKEYAVSSITEVPNIYFAMGFSGVDKGTPMVHHDNVLTSVFYANGTPVEAMPQYAGKDYYDFKNKMATGGNLDFNNLADIKKGDFLVQENKYGNQLVQVLKIRNKEIVVQNINSETIFPQSWSIGDLEDTNFRVLSKSERKNVFGEPEKLNLTYPKSSGFEERKPENILHSYLQANKLSKIKRYQVFRDGKLVYDTLDDGFLRTDYAKRNYKYEDGGNVAEDEDYYRVFRNNAGKDIAVKIVKNPIFGKFDYYVDGTLRGQFDSFAQARQEVNYENFDMYKDGGNLHSSEFYAKGGVVVTSIKDIPNFKEENEAGRITYRGLGMGKLSDDFYKVAGENGTRIKVNGKEYNITMTEFNTFGRDSSGKMRIKFAAPLRKFADGGNLHSSEFYEDGGEIVDYQKKSNIFIARYNGKKIELEATSMFDAEKKAIQQLKVPKSKRGLLSVMNKQAYEKGDFQFN